MDTDVHGPWVPLGLAAVRALLAGARVPWWIAGGHALELHVGRSWRTHADVDVAICRRDAAAFVGHLRGWEVAIAAAGRLSAWDGRALDAQRHENNLWCRRPGGPWALDVLVGEGDDDDWIFRRDARLRLPWSRAVLRSADGTPYLAPGLQLLFKSAAPRPHDDLDAREVVPRLAAEHVAVLAVQLPREHPWRSLLSAHQRPFAATDVVEVVDLLAAAGVPAWLDGGWAVDALLGVGSRPHADLDLALPTRVLPAALAALGRAGFVQLRDDGPFNRVLLDRVGRLVDVHAFDDRTTVVDDDGVLRCGPDGLAYEAAGFDGRGTVGGREVACIGPDVLVRYHTGYAVDEDDWHDVRLLHERFGVAVPADYDRWQRDRSGGT